MASDKQRLVKALREANATELQCRMATILLAVNGIGDALEFVAKVAAARSGGEGVGREGCSLYVDRDRTHGAHR